MSDTVQFQKLMDLRLGKGKTLQKNSRTGHWEIWSVQKDGMRYMVWRIKSEDGSPRPPADSDIDRVQKMRRDAEKLGANPGEIDKFMDKYYRDASDEMDRAYDEKMAEHAREFVVPRVRHMLGHGRVHALNGGRIPRRKRK